MLNVLSLFSGIGAFEKALTNLKIPFNLLAYCEKDRYASKSYSAIHGVPESMNLWDVTKVDWLDIDEMVDLITYGFPCQDISIAGQQKGFTDEDGNRTRSGLFFEALRIIEDFNPKFAIAENVKALTSKKFTNEFKIVLESLENAGYVNYWAVLNLKDYGIPHKRPRVFIVSIRRDIDKGFIFPEPIPLELKVKDLLEKRVDEKYYLSEKMITYILDINETQTGTKWENRANSAVLNPDIAYTLAVRSAGGHQRAGVSNFLIDGIDGEITVKKVKENIKTTGKSDSLRIRRFTPTECYKLLGFTAEDCRKASEGGISDPQLYKQAGNSIGVNVLEAIYTNLGRIYEEFRV